MKENLTNVERRYILDFCFERGMNANSMSVGQAIEHVQSRLELSNMLSKTTDHRKLFVLKHKKTFRLKSHL